MHTRFFNMFHYSADNSCFAVRNRIHVHFHGTVVGGRQGMNELSNHVANTIMQGTRRHLAGQNA